MRGWQRIDLGQGFSLDYRPTAESAAPVIHKMLRYARTLRYLKPVQVWGRIAFRLFRPKPDQRPAPTLRRVVDMPGWQPPVVKALSMVAPQRFRFLNVEGDVSSARDWDAPNAEKLWLYNLHYFDDLNAEGAHERSEWHDRLIARWIAEIPPGKGNGWEPYPTSLRIVNWIKRHAGGGALADDAIQSLAVQARWLSRRLERHILGNHLLANAKALVFAGLFFDGPEAKAWLKLGKDILDFELHEQILADGGHFERSPMYHNIVLEDVLDLLNMAGRAGWTAPQAWREAVPAMAFWAEAMLHPDGEIAFFNDSSFGIAATRDDLRDYARRLGLDWPAPPATSILLLPSGYARLGVGPCVALVDVAPVGPDYLPGHAHADTLSLEASIGTARVIVNSGTSVYGTGPDRQAQRSTATHSTIRLDGMDSSEVWAGFRVGRRARVHDVRSLADGRGVEAWHDGYRHQSGKPVHRRRVVVSDDGGTLEIIDVIEGGGSHIAEAFFHLHPAVVVKPDSDQPDTFILSFPDGGVTRTGRIVVEGADTVTLDNDGLWHSQFGVSESASRIIAVRQGPLPLRLRTRLQSID